MVASLNKTWTQSPYNGDGLGKATPLGVGFLRNVTITMTGVATYAFVAADFGFNSIIDVLSLVGDTTSNTGYFVTSLTSAGFTLNAPVGSVVKVKVIGIGI